MGARVAGLAVAGHEAYLDGLARRFAGLGFAVWRSYPLTPYVLDLLAAGRRAELSKFGQMARVVSVAHLDPVNPATVSAYSAWVAKYALEGGFATLPRGFGGSVLCVPAVVADGVDEGTKAWIQQAPAPRHFAAFEFPAIVSLSEGRVYHCTRTPLWGAAYYGGFRRFAQEMLQP